jgi:hypothetical protein
MARTQKIEIDYARIAKQYNISLIPNGWRWFQFRVAIAFLLIRLGAWVGGFGYGKEDEQIQK